MMNIAINFDNSFYNGFALCDTPKKVVHVLSIVSGNISMKGFSSPETAYRHCCRKFFLTRVTRQENLRFHLPRMESITGTCFIYTVPADVLRYPAPNHIFAGIYNNNVIIATSSAVAVKFMETYPLAYMQKVNSPEEATYLLNAWSFAGVLPLCAYINQPIHLMAGVPPNTLYSTNKPLQFNLQFVPKLLQTQRISVIERTSTNANINK